MRWTVLALSAIAALLTSCATENGNTGFQTAPTSYSLRRGETSTRRSSSKAPSSPSAAEPSRQSAALTRRAVLKAITEAESSTDRLARPLRQLAASKFGIATQVNGIFTRYVDYGSEQMLWLGTALRGATSLADISSEVADPDMELALLRMSGPRLQAAMSGTLLLATWIDFLKLTDSVLQQCPFYSHEQLFVDMLRIQKLIEPSMTALASLDPAQVEAATTALPQLMGQLTHEFQSLREAARVAAERGGKVMMAAQLIETLSLMSALEVSLPRLPPAAPALMGAGLVMGSDGVMMGSRIVVSAEWVEMVRKLVQAGVLSAPAVSAAVRINAGLVMMAQTNRDLPQGVREALGDGPEVGAMHETGKAGAGMAERPRHHVLPDEYREWFEKRGFTGDMNIDQFCVELENADHQAIHGGGNWRQGRTWPGEWNQMIMDALQQAEKRAGRMLTPSEILETVAFHMKRYNLPMRFTPWRGQ